MRDASESVWATQREKRRPSDHVLISHPHSMRSKSNNANSEDNLNCNNKEQQKIHRIVQNSGPCAAEMFSAHIAQLVISYVVHSALDNIMNYIQCFDRQDAIQCSDINFVQGFPLFMVLLRAMKRTQFVQQGHNSIFKPLLGFSGEVYIMDQQNELVDLKFNLKSHECTTHFCLHGHAITLFSVENKNLSGLVSEVPRHSLHTGTDELVAKLYQPEESCESDSEKGHVLEMAWFHQFEDTSPAKIRMALGMDAERGNRISYTIVSRRLCPITNLSGKELLSAWWQIVVFLLRSLLSITATSALANLWYTRPQIVDILEYSTTSIYHRLEIVPQAKNVQSYYNIVANTTQPVICLCSTMITPIGSI
ncbi:hypothetical protein EDB19DRAFT_718097 [Suillus lakei]|nr:hypothetical protein EDB19DRAFT_718097 [Suillus lakei]